MVSDKNEESAFINGNDPSTVYSRQALEVKRRLFEADSLSPTPVRALPQTSLNAG